MAQSELEALLALQIRAMGLPTPKPEHTFHPGRRWRADFAWPDEMLLVEVEGGSYVYGRHNRPAGMEADCEKYNQAVLDGWRVLRFTGGQVKRGEALDVIRRALKQESEGRC